MGFEDAIKLVTITSNAIENEEGEPMLRIGPYGFEISHA